MEGPFFEIDGEHLFRAPFSVTEPEGYQPTKNAEGQVFPDCCNYHQNVLKHVEDWFSKFPDCCPEHRKMAKGKNFNLANYPGVPAKLMRQLSYTEFHISQKIEAEDWYDDITDFIEFNIQSFGHPSAGSGLYFHYVETYVKAKRKDVPKVKYQMLLEYFKAATTNKGQQDPVSLNLLYSTYQKWLKAFPFDLKIFEGKKEAIEKSIPILDSETHYNRYSKLTSAKVITPTKMIEVLVGATEDLLRSVNSHQLVQNGIIPDISTHLLDLINQSHRVKQTALLGAYTSSEIRYVTILKTWLENEKVYFKDLSDFFQDKKPVVTKQRRLETTLSKYQFTELAALRGFTAEKSGQLYDLLATSSIPYQIALLDHIGFMTHLKQHYVRSDVKLFKTLADILATTERLVKGNIYVLNPLSKENRSRYTADQHQEQVKADFAKIK